MCTIQFVININEYLLSILFHSDCLIPSLFLDHHSVKATVEVDFLERKPNLSISWKPVYTGKIKNHWCHLHPKLFTHVMYEFCFHFWSVDLCMYYVCKILILSLKILKDSCKNVAKILTRMPVRFWSNPERFKWIS